MFALAATRSMNELAHMHWAADAASRPFSLVDLFDDDAEKRRGAFAFFSSLSLEDTKSECKMHGLPISGAKYKLFQSLTSHAQVLKCGKPNRGEAAPGKAMAPLTTDEKTVLKVRKALIADLRKCLVFDKKLKKPGACKMLKAKYSNCTPELFQAIFPHAAGKKKCAVTLQQLGVDRIGKNLRYGSTIDAVPGSLSSKYEDGVISMSGKYSLGYGGFF